LAINNFKKEEELFFSSLSYLTIGIIGIFMLVSDIKDSEYLEFHAKDLSFTGLSQSLYG